MINQRFKDLKLISLTLLGHEISLLVDSEVEFRIRNNYKLNPLGRNRGIIRWEYLRNLSIA